MISETLMMGDTAICIVVVVPMGPSVFEDTNACDGESSGVKDRG